MSAIILYVVSLLVFAIAVLGRLYWVEHPDVGIYVSCALLAGGSFVVLRSAARHARISRRTALLLLLGGTVWMAGVSLLGRTGGRTVYLLQRQKLERVATLMLSAGDGPTDSLRREPLSSAVHDLQPLRLWDPETDKRRVVLPVECGSDVLSCEWVALLYVPPGEPAPTLYSKLLSTGQQMCIGAVEHIGGDWYACRYTTPASLAASRLAVQIGRIIESAEGCRVEVRIDADRIRRTLQEKFGTTPS